MGSWKSRQITLQNGNRWRTSLEKRGGYLFSWIRCEGDWNWLGDSKTGPELYCTHSLVILGAGALGRGWRGRSVCLKVSWRFLHSQQLGMKHTAATNAPGTSESPFALSEPRFPYLHSGDFTFSHRDVPVPLRTFWALSDCANTRVQAHTAPLTHWMPPSPLHSRDPTDHKPNIPVSNAASWPRQDAKNGHLTFNFDRGLFIMIEPFIWER